MDTTIEPYELNGDIGVNQVEVVVLFVTLHIWRLPLRCGGGTLVTVRELSQLTL